MKNRTEDTSPLEWSDIAIAGLVVLLVVLILVLGIGPSHPIRID